MRKKNLLKNFLFVPQCVCVCVVVVSVMNFNFSKIRQQQRSLSSQACKIFIIKKNPHTYR